MGGHRVGGEVHAPAGGVKLCSRTSPTGRAMRVGELLAARATADIVGREAELAALRQVLEPSGLRIVHIHGLPGIGKSTLLQAFAAEASECGAAVLLLDCREIEPTPGGFAAAVEQIAGISASNPEDMATQLGASARIVVLALDSYEVFRLLDTWLRQTFIPALPNCVQVVFAGRHQPAVGWRFGGWEKLALNLPVEPLPPDKAAAVLEATHLDRPKRQKLAEALHGHPLALRLAASMLSEQPRLVIPEVTLQRVMAELTALYLSEVGDDDRRDLLEGASMVRRVTVPLLASMFPQQDPETAYRRLEQLTFTETVRDGLRLHDGVREAIAQTVQARDPERALGYRRDAWRALTGQASAAGRSELWRYTADILYLIENPVVREAFFPSGGGQVSVESGQPHDRSAIRAIVEAHEGPAAASWLLNWWDHHRQSFVVVRGVNGECEGFCCRMDPEQTDRRHLSGDPVTAAWLSDLEENPLPEGKRVLFIRRWLDRTAGERPGNVQAACWLDLKRTYMEMRPELQRVYLTVVDLEPYAAAATQLGFRVLEDRELRLDGRAYQTAVLDFGPDSVDGWLAELAAAELGLPLDTSILDREARELVLDDCRTGLTPLEFGVLSHLCDREGVAVSREELLREVWRSEYTGWSNKVDAVVAGLRQKLGDRADSIETVRGVGYRYRQR